MMYNLPPSSPKPPTPEQPSPEGLTAEPLLLTAVPLFGLWDEMEFRRHFAIQFLASYAATHFNDLCANGRQDSLERLPVEDAEYLSGTAWRHWCYTMPMKRI
jgi:hypothetical protein